MDEFWYVFVAYSITNKATITQSQNLLTLIKLKRKLRFYWLVKVTKWRKIQIPPWNKKEKRKKMYFYYEKSNWEYSDFGFKLYEQNNIYLVRYQKFSYSEKVK